MIFYQTHIFLYNFKLETKEPNEEYIFKKSDDNLIIYANKVEDILFIFDNYLEFKINDRNFVLCHYPLQSWHGLNKGVIHLHGHVHLGREAKFGNGKRMDVGVDGNGLDPYSIDEIIRIMDKRPVGSDMSGDHHLDDLVGVVG